MAEDSYKTSFPDVQVDVGGGNKVMMRPLPLNKLGTLSGAFTKIVGEATVYGLSSALVNTAIDDFLSLLPSCCDTDVDKIPAKYVFKLLDVFLAQNIDEETVGNYSALMERVGIISKLVSEKLALAKRQEELDQA